MEHNIGKILDELDIPFKEYKHNPIYTVEDATKLSFNEEITEVINLFLRNRNKSMYYLFCIPVYKKKSLAQLAEIAKEKKLSFASEKDLLSMLGVGNGSVSIFNAINDRKKEINYYIDECIMESSNVAFHPNRNDCTLLINGNRLNEWFEYLDLNKICIFK